MPTLTKQTASALRGSYLQPPIIELEVIKAPKIELEVRKARTKPGLLLLNAITPLDRRI